MIQLIKVTHHYNSEHSNENFPKNTPTPEFIEEFNDNSLNLKSHKNIIQQEALEDTYGPKDQNIPFPHIKGDKDIERSFACLRMMARFFNLPFKKDLITNIQQADLCITRAGASTLAELSLMNIPFIAVPLPKSKDNHQLENANYYKDKDCCWIIEQNNFEEKIQNFLEDIFKDKSDLLKKKENLKKLNYQNTWINVNQKILKILNEN